MARIKQLDAQNALWLIAQCERELMKLRDLHRANGLAETDAAADTRSMLRKVAKELQQNGKRSAYAEEA